MAALAQNPLAKVLGDFDIVWRQRSPKKTVLPRRRTMTEHVPLEGENLVDESTGYYIVHEDKSVIFLSRLSGRCLFISITANADSCVLQKILMSLKLNLLFYDVLDLIQNLLSHYTMLCTRLF